MILAVPPWTAQELAARPDRAGRVLRHRQRATSSSPRRPALPLIVGLIGGTAEWVFAFPDRLSVTVSAADRLVDIDSETLARFALARCRGRPWPCRATTPPWRIVKEKRATFAATPAQNARRPSSATRWSNLFLAGDWTDTGLPATIEGALRSGERAAALACRVTPAMNSSTSRQSRFAASAARRRRCSTSSASDGHWVFELEADATIPSEYVLLRHYLGEPDDLELERKIGVYLRRIQGEHGGWPLFHGGAFDISATVKAYFCLKMIGDDPRRPAHGAGARGDRGAAAACCAPMSSRASMLAQFGELSWNDVPTIPVELILLPRWFPIHLSRMSYWARTVMVPLLVLAALKPRARNPRGVRIPELLLPPDRLPPKPPSHQKRVWALLLQRAGSRAEGGRAVLAARRCANAPSIAAGASSPSG